MYRSIVTALLAITALAVAGCAETEREEATGKVQIRGVNGIVDSADALFLIEETTINQLTYKSSTAQREFDNLSYTFNYDLPVPLNPNRRLASQFVDVVEDNEYTFVLAGDIDTPQIVLWERPNPVWDGTETVFDIGAGHVNTTIGDVDVYFLPDGTPPALGNALGSVDFSERTADREEPAGDYVITLTARDDPSTVLFQSFPLVLAGATSYTIMLFDADPSITSPISVRLVDLAGTSLEVGDVNFPATAQFVNAAFGSGNVDVVADGDFDNRLLVDLPFGIVSDDLDIEQGPVTYSYTPTGSTMSLLDVDLTVLRGTRSMIVLLGEAGNLGALALGSDRRGFSTVARYRVTNASFNAEDIDVYFNTPGESIDNRPPNIFALGFSAATDMVPQFGEDFELIITRRGEKTPLAGPEPITFNVNDVIEIVVLDSADPNVSELLIFNNNAP